MRDHAGGDIVFKYIAQSLYFNWQGPPWVLKYLTVCVVYQETSSSSGESYPLLLLFE